MPIDKSSKPPPSKPITPALSTRFRTAKAPLAPRLAGSAPTSPAVSSQSTFRNKPLSPTGNQNQPASLNGNITPRSGARNSRTGNDSPGTPSTGQQPTRPSKTLSPRPNQILAHQGLAISSPSGILLGQPRPTITRGFTTGTAILPRRASGESIIGRAKDESKFFRADDAKSSTSLQRPQPISRSKTTNYARAPSPARTAPVVSNSVQNRISYDISPRYTEKASSSTIASVKTLQTQKASPTSGLSVTSRIDSTPRQVNHSPNPITPLAATLSSQPQHDTTPERLAKPVSAATSPQTIVDRRRSAGSSSSIARPMTSGHRKSLSANTLTMTSFKSMIDLKSVNAEPALSWSPTIVTSPKPPSTTGAQTSPDTLSPRSISLASSNTAPTSTKSDTDRSDVSKAGAPAAFVKHVRTQSELQIQSQPPVDAAANARRERKVLDLEISNSSLLAINKTLEKELRKQGAELRRFRRLSRSGRLSLAPSNRSVSGQSLTTLDTLEELEQEDNLNSDSDEDKSDIDDFEEGDSALSNDSASLQSSTDRARQRTRDERRLMLDLSKHQQLLIDSQKLSQGIQRCVNSTDEMIREASKALAYRVGIGDVKLGGRVLTADDEEEDMHHPDDFENKRDLGDPREARQGLLSPIATKTALEEAAMWFGGLQSLHERNAMAREQDPLEANDDFRDSPMSLSVE